MTNAPCLGSMTKLYDVPSRLVVVVVLGLCPPLLGGKGIDRLNTAPAVCQADPTSFD
jgi:hypothetical protein